MAVRKTPSPIVQNDRVRLRWWESRDDAKQRSWTRYSDPCSHLWNIPRTSAPGDGMFNIYSSSTLRRTWAIENSDGILVGRISLRDIDQGAGRARLGISLAAAHVGHGLGTAALRLFIDYFFDEMGFRKMVLDVAAFNRRAVRCYERLGFQEVGNDWRKTSGGQCTRELENPANAELRPYFRRERSNLWVQFLEMELCRGDWYEQKLSNQ